MAKSKSQKQRYFWFRRLCKLAEQVLSLVLLVLEIIRRFRAL